MRFGFPDAYVFFGDTRNTFPGEIHMAKGEQKKGRENKKPKQDGKSGGKSAYQQGKGEIVASPYLSKVKKK